MSNLLERIVRGEDLAQHDAESLMHTLTDPRTDPAWSAAVLAALRTKGETGEEVRGFAVEMGRLARRVDLPLAAPVVDLVGTGGDGSGSLNISTAAALLTAACGVPVAKHGNRSISSRSGSADLLEELGYAIPADADGVRESIAELGFAFLFAPYFHPAMKTVGPVRKAMGIRTVFNILGPLANPASPPYAVIGAFSPAVARLMAEALSGMPITRAFVVHGEPGWDEATPCGPFLLFDVRPGRVEEQHREPRDFGIPRCDPGDLAGGNAVYNAIAVRDVFAGEQGPHRDALTLGAGLALEVTGVAPDLGAGIERAREALDSGAAAALLERFGGE